MGTLSWLVVGLLSLVCMDGSQSLPTGSTAMLYPSTYVIMAPNTIRPGRPLTLSVNILDAVGPVSLEVFVAHSGTEVCFQQTETCPLRATDVAFANVPKDITLQIPDLPPPPGGNYYLQVRGSGGLTFLHTNATLEYRLDSFIILVQTDKAAYKPGQTVQFRTMAVEPDLTPCPDAFFNIRIKDADGNIIRQWISAQSDNFGVFSGELILSTRPVLGLWSIEVTKDRQTKMHEILIDEFVLPRFDVRISNSPAFTDEDSSITITAEASFTFGRPLQGTASLEFGLKYASERFRPLDDIELVDGVARFTITMADLLPIFARQFATGRINLFDGQEFAIHVNVTDELSGRTEGADSCIQYYRSPVQVKEHPDNPRFFKPGFPFNLRLVVFRADGEPLTAVNLDRLFLTIRRDRNDTVEFTISSDGIVSFSIPVSTEQNSLNLDVNATYCLGPLFQGNCINDILTIYKSALESQARSYLCLEQMTPDLRVGNFSQFRVTATEPDKTVWYQVIAKGNILLTRTSNSLTLGFSVTSEMAPCARLIAYYVGDCGEIIPDILEFAVDDVFRHDVRVSFSQPEASPGIPVVVTVRADPNSFVGILAVDRSVQLLRDGNDLSRNDILSSLQSIDTTPIHRYGYYGPFGPAVDFGPVFRRKRAVDPQFEADSAGSLFDDAGMIVYTDSYVHYKANFFLPEGPVLALPGDAQFDRENTDTTTTDENDVDPGDDSVARVRTDFPETWLWHDYVTQSDGTVVMTTTVPDTITTWVLSAFGLSFTNGLGLAEPVELLSRQNFFISMNLPFSVVRGEQCELRISVFNYFPFPLTATVIFGPTEQYDIVLGDEEFATGFEPPRILNIPSNRGVSASYAIVPRELGSIELNVRAISDFAQDAVTRELLVKPEGFENLNTSTSLFLSDALTSVSRTLDVMVDIPVEDLVVDSIDARLYFTGDIMGTTLNNLDALLRLPTGCGEQNMISFAPDTFILQYLEVAGLANDNIRSKALFFLETGYQRQLTYKHGDCSYSAFGENDKYERSGKPVAGSTWLTAFVVKSFSQAMQFIYIDTEELECSIEFLIDKQQSDGSFLEEGRLVDGGIEGGVSGKAALTAYVLIALLEASNTGNLMVDTPELLNAITEAQQYLIDQRSNMQLDKFTLAISTYALALNGHSEVDNFRMELDRLANVTQDFRFWTNNINTNTMCEDPAMAELARRRYYRPPSFDIEMTAYALLAYVTLGDIEGGQPILNWLIEQQLASGGFGSTQDTVVAIQALAEYAARLPRNPSSTIILSSPDDFRFQRVVNVNQLNALELQEVELPSTIRRVSITGTTMGVLVMSLSTYYNTLRPLSPCPAFHFTVDVTDVTVYRIKIMACGRYMGSRPATGMSIMEIGIPSGFTASREYLEEAKANGDELFRDYEIRDREVICYFDEIPEDSSVCVVFFAERTSTVGNGQMSYATLSAYYNRDELVTVSYLSPQGTGGICDICPACGCLPPCGTLVCPQVFEPLCGSDGITYSSRCNFRAQLACRDPEDGLVTIFKPDEACNACDSSPCMNGECNVDTFSAGGYSCICNPGYTGINCDIEVGNPCDSRPCENGDCTANTFSLEGYTCTCFSGYTGFNCEVEIVPPPGCGPNSPCLNGGFCIFSRCICVPPFEGILCETEPGDDPCQPDPCVNGLCLPPVIPGTEYFCFCFDGFEGPECDQPAGVDPCQPDPCVNGRCIPNVVTGSGYFCLCSDGFQGINCDQPTGPIGCRNCTLFLGPPCTVADSTEVCFSCPPGFQCCDNCCGGQTCLQVITDPCDTISCDGSYNPVCGTDGVTYDNFCELGKETCRNPQVLFQSFGECEVTDCTPNPCRNGGSCVPTTTGYLCLCLEGFSGEYCETGECDFACITLFDPVCGSDGITYGNGCELSRAACRDPSIVQLHGGACTGECDFPCNDLYDPVCGSDGVTYSNGCELSRAACRDPSISQIHDGECTDVTPGCVDCAAITMLPCPPGSNIERCGVCPEATHVCCDNCCGGNRCIPRITLPGACASSPCRNGGSCIPLGPFGYECRCPSGYSGNNCENELDVCWDCSRVRVDCNVRPPTETCRFCPNATHECCENCCGGQTCVPRELGPDPCDNNPCRNGGSCLSRGREYMCNCPIGIGGYNCTDVGTDRIPPFIFDCIGVVHQYLINSDRVSVIWNEPGYFDDRGGNVVLQSGPQVTSGFFPMGDFTLSYVYRDEAGNTGSCNVDIIVEALDCGNLMVCTGSEGSVCGTDLVTYPNICALRAAACSALSGPPSILYNGPCSDFDPCDFDCGNFTRPVCGTDGVTYRNPCELAKNVCRFGGMALSQVGFCDVPPPVDPCLFTSCFNGGSCMPDADGSAWCLCPLQYGGRFCDIFDVGCDLNPCRNGGSCIPLVVTYICVCPNGYSGENCEIPTGTGCNPNPCRNGGSCIPVPTGSFCICQEGFSGEYCETGDCPPIICTLEYDPVCGSDGVTYGNPCQFEGAQCEDPYLTYTPGECGTVTGCTPNPCRNGGSCIPVPTGSFCICQQGFSGQYCETGDCPPIACTLQYDPVCGSDGVTYGNTCQFEGAQCEDPYLTYTPGECGTGTGCNPNPCRNGGSCIPVSTGSFCICQEGFSGEYCETGDCPPIACTLEYDPVCGSDGITYGNPCQFEGAQCEDPFLTYTPGECGTGACDFPCIALYDPVCGSDGITYSNDCERSRATCRDPSIVRQHDGECEDECNFACIALFDPVCGSDGSTYGNDCELSRATCRDPSIVRLHDGECEDNSCIPNPCSNGGTCVLRGTGYTCRCLEGFFGETCDTVLCPDGSIPGANCPVDLCYLASCPFLPDAECRVNYCDNCNTEWWLDGEQVNCDGLCPDGSLPVDCFVDPCLFSSCRVYPNAECRANYCGGCNAEWWLDGEQVNCDGLCPDGSRPFNCFVDPCQFASCRVYPNAECRANYCGGCNAEWWLDGEQVNCDGLCPDGSLPVNCFVDPCQFASCPLYPNAECRSNYCGGCNAEWFLDGDQVICDTTVCNFPCAEIFAPVCGSDGVTYPNECELRRAACLDPSVVQVSTGLCPVCDFPCIEIFAPVCGSDGVTYHNACELNRAACLDPSVIQVSIGPCPVCDFACPAVFAPVCGSDGVTYPSSCDLSRAACSNPSITQVSTGPCPEGCGSFPCENDGICRPGTAGVSFTCECIFGFSGVRCEIPPATGPCANLPCQAGGLCGVIGPNDFVCACPSNRTGLTCEQDASVADLTAPFYYDCPSMVQGFITDGGVVRVDWQPVNVIDDREGELRTLSGLQSEFGFFPVGTFTLTYSVSDEGQNQGSCVFPVIIESIDCSNLNCSDLPEPVCGSNGQTYFTECELQNAACAIDFLTVQYRGPCRPDPCDKECPNFNRPICGTDGVTYLNLCELSIETCRSGVELYNEGICDACESEPCLNGGDCRLTAFGTYFCMCPTGFRGQNCEMEEVSPCEMPNVCQNGGTCAPDDSSVGYNCICADGFFGRNCELAIQPCSSNPCLNGGTCVPGDVAFFCMCLDGFRGRTCEIDNNVLTITCPSNNSLTMFELPNVPNVRQQILVVWPPVPCVDTTLPNLNLFGSCNETSGTVFNPGNTVVGCSCTSPSGNVARCTFTVNIPVPDACDSLPCLNGGECQSTPFGNYICMCPTGFRGLNCEVAFPILDITCPEASSVNVIPLPTGQSIAIWPNLICTEGTGLAPSVTSCNHTLGSIFTPGDTTVGCQCTNAAGDIARCTFNVNVPDACDSQPCVNGGECQLVPIGDYICNCPTGFTGRNCEEVFVPLDIMCPAASSVNVIPIPNGQSLAIWPNPTCNEGNIVPSCNRTLGSFFTPGITTVGCQCANAAEVASCTFIVDVPIPDPCASGPCLNGATCRPTTPGNFMCLCTEGFTGLNCDQAVLSIACPASSDVLIIPTPNGQLGIWGLPPCTQGGAISPIFSSCDPSVASVFSPGTTSVTCSCSSLAGDMASCTFNVDIPDPCSSNPCVNGATCSPTTTGDYTCQCAAGFTGLNCDQVLDPCASDPCLNGAICRPTTPGNYMCLCTEGFTGVNCDQAVLNIVCPASSDVLIIPTPNGQLGVWGLPPCTQGGAISPIFSSCDPSVGTIFSPGTTSVTCSCSSLAGDMASCTFNVDIPVTDPCASSPCLNGATCSPTTPGNYVCQCTEGFAGLNCDQAVLSIACPASSDVRIIPIPSGQLGIWTLPPCTEGGVVVPVVSTCVPPVITFSPGTTSASVTCSCSRLPGDMASCTFNVDVPAAPTLEITCPDPMSVQMFPITDGRVIALWPAIQCVDSATPGLPVFGDCNPGSASTFQPGNTVVECSCSNADRIASCSFVVNAGGQGCASFPCENDGVCIPGADGVSFTCQCIFGFSGPLCQNAPAVQTACNPNPCMNGGLCNLVGANGFSCDCPATFIGTRCEQVQTACNPNPCQNGGVCNLQGINGFSCTCTNGFTGVTCGQVQTACNPNPCMNGGLCNLVGANGFSCDCPATFIGTRCEQEQTACNPNPCQNGGACNLQPSTFSGFSCTCTNGFSGVTCVQSVLSFPQSSTEMLQTVSSTEPVAALSCTVENNSGLTSEITWFRNGLAIEQGGRYFVTSQNSLLILGLSSVDAGLYQCQATIPSENISITMDINLVLEG